MGGSGSETETGQNLRTTAAARQKTRHGRTGQRTARIRRRAPGARGSDGRLAGRRGQRTGRTGTTAGWPAGRLCFRVREKKHCSVRVFASWGRLIHAVCKPRQPPRWEGEHAPQAKADMFFVMVGGVVCVRLLAPTPRGKREKNTLLRRRETRRRPSLLLFRYTTGRARSLIPPAAAHPRALLEQDDRPRHAPASPRLARTAACLPSAHRRRRTTRSRLSLSSRHGVRRRHQSTTRPIRGHGRSTHGG